MISSTHVFRQYISLVLSHSFTVTVHVTTVLLLAWDYLHQECIHSCLHVTEFLKAVTCVSCPSIM